MNYNRDSFLAGIAVGRQLKGWNLYPDAASVHGWTADPSYLWRNPGILGYIPPSTQKTYQDVGSVSGTYDYFSGNVIEGIGNQSFYLQYGYLPGDPPRLFDITVTQAATNGIWVHYYNSPSILDIPIPATGVFVTTSTSPQHYAGAHADGLGRGTIKAETESAFMRNFVMYSSGGKTNILINAVYSNERCIVPGGDSFWKKRSGLCIACLVRYRTSGGAYVTTPVLISDLQQATEWTYRADGIVQTANTGLYLWHGLYWYMSTCGKLLSGIPQSDTGAAILDLTSGSTIANDQELFDAVAYAAGLMIL